MPRKSSAAPPGRPKVKVRLLAALTFDGKLCPPVEQDAALSSDGSAGAGEHSAWHRLWRDLSARSEVLLVDDENALGDGASAGGEAGGDGGDGGFILPIPADSTLPLARIRLDLGLHVSACLRELRKARGVKNVLCVGSPALFRALLEQDLVDELHLLMRPLVSGARSQPTLSGWLGEYFAHSLTWRLRRMEAVENGECVLEYRRMKAAAAESGTKKNLG